MKITTLYIFLYGVYDMKQQQYVQTGITTKFKKSVLLKKSTEPAANNLLNIIPPLHSINQIVYYTACEIPATNRITY